MNTLDEKYKTKSGKWIETVMSNKNSAGQYGQHYILQFCNELNRQELSKDDISEFYALLEFIALKLSENHSSGLFQIHINGPETAQRKHLHAHIVCFDKSAVERDQLEIPRLTEVIQFKKRRINLLQ